MLNSPESFESELAGVAGIKIHRNLEDVEKIGFAIVFVLSQEEIDAYAGAIAQKAPGDSVIWFAYPKGTSKKYKCSINRESGWEALGRAGFEPVRQVAIDEDWSAVRFRRAEFIKKMTRSESFAMSEEGKSRTKI